jgi:hypothetical protein
MQDVDRVSHVQRLAQPPRDRGSRVQVKPLRLVPRSKDCHGINGHPGRRRHVGENSAIRAPEAKLPVRLPIELEALLMDGAVVAATEQGEVRERGGPPIGPVTDVMPLADADAAAREAAAPVSMVQGPP